MRILLPAVSALALSGSLAFAQTTPPPENGPTAEQPDAPSAAPAGEELDAGGMERDTGETARGENVEGQEMRGPGRRHHMERGGPRGGPGWRAMRSGPEFKVEIDEDGSVKIEAKCSPREETRACAEVTMELLDRALGN